MQRKLTITVHKEVYAGLRKVIGPRRISRFIEDLVRPHVLKARLESAYERGKLGVLALISRQSFSELRDQVPCALVEGCGGGVRVWGKSEIGLN